MTTTYSGTGFPRDADSRNLADTIYGIMPSRSLNLSSADIRAASTRPEMPQRGVSSSPSSKRKGTSDSDDLRTGASPLRRQHSGYWTAATPGKRGRLQHGAHKSIQAELHQSICLNFSSLDNAESDLWILPDFEEWELSSSPVDEAPMKRDGNWPTLVERAANSNRERLRRRLEGDGWDFVGGKYGEDGKVYDAGSGSEGSVDEEFDVVVLPIIPVS
ncbi:hypothetical protein CC78DRAFT_234493 [Lojkania enalia]|uniref:Uncharacterized protein n=1 Tax=Lojkania enalia TaxID=147567 RepID=A0A9P4K870_9PLEO|nr:hypothetical protein CC78DRAFT_234493 [Didymosphaeria enalia]